MIRKMAGFSIALAMLVPVFAHGEEGDGLITAMCRQIISSEGLTFDKIIERVKSLPKNAVLGAMDFIDSSSESLADSLELTKADTEDSNDDSSSKSRVLGAVSGSGTLYNKFMDTLAFLVRNWGWTLGGLALVYITWRMSRFA